MISPGARASQKAGFPRRPPVTLSVFFWNAAGLVYRTPTDYCRPTMAGRVLFLAPDLAASFYRTWAPALALRAAGHKAEVVDAVLPGHITGYDTLAAWTEYTAPALMSIDHANNAGVHTVYELEDDWWSVDPSHPGHAV